MAKRDKKQRPAKMTRKYLSRIEREQRQILYIRIGAIVVATGVILLLLAGLFKTQVAEPSATRSAKEALKTTAAVTINGDMISIAEWQARVRFQRQLLISQVTQLNQQLSLFDPSTEIGQQFIAQGQDQIQEISSALDFAEGIATEVLQQMVEEQLVRQEAQRRGITVTPEEVQKYIEVDLFAYPFAPTPEPLPTLPSPTVPPTVTVTPQPTLTPTTVPTPRSREDFEADYQLYTEQVQELTEMTETMWRSMIEGGLYEEKLLAAFREEVETNAQQVKGRYIAADDEETAKVLLARLEAGRPFEDLEAEIDADESEDSAARTGFFDWSPADIVQERFGDEFSTAVFDTDPGNYVQDVIPASDGGFYLVFVEGNETRELADYLVEQRQLDLFQTWLDEQRLGDGIVYGGWRPYIPKSHPFHNSRECQHTALIKTRGGSSKPVNLCCSLAGVSRKRSSSFAPRFYHVG